METPQATSRLQVRFENATHNNIDTNNPNNIKVVTSEGNNTTNIENQGANVPPTTCTLLTPNTLQPTIATGNLVAITALPMSTQISFNNYPDAGNGLNISYKVETRDIPELPSGK